MILEPRAPGKLKQISPKRIEKNPENPRLIFRQEEMESLMLSIGQHGIQVPLTVFESNGIYTLIDGERRWRCALKLNLKSVPALVQDKPTELQNLLLMYNIHALREQWDYFTIASKLGRIIDLFLINEGRAPKERELSELTGLTAGQIRRCRLLLDLPERYKETLLEELNLPKSRQKLTEDFFIEMERSLKTIFRRIDGYQTQDNEIRDALITKFRDGRIGAVTDFRDLAKIATAVDNLGFAQKQAKKSLNRIFDVNDRIGIRDAYAQTVEFEYDEKKALRHIDQITGFVDEVLEEGSVSNLAPEFIESLTALYERLSRLLEVYRD